MTSLLLTLIHVAKWIVLAHVIMSWLINFSVLNLRQPLVYRVWSGLNRLLEPVYERVRRVLPAISGIDLAPLAVLIAILLLEELVSRNAAILG